MEKKYKLIVIGFVIISMSFLMSEFRPIKISAEGNSVSERASQLTKEWMKLKDKLHKVTVAEGENQLVDGRLLLIELQIPSECPAPN